MSGYYFDSSALVKRYVREPGTDVVRTILHPDERNAVYVAQITGVEVVAAIARAGRQRYIERDAQNRAVAEFRVAFERDFYVIGLNLAVVRLAMNLAEQHVLRGYDAVQLATAVHINNRLRENALAPATFVSADTALNAIARQAGLTVLNPVTASPQ